MRNETYQIVLFTFSSEKRLRENSSKENLKSNKNALPNKSEILEAFKNVHSGWNALQLMYLQLTWIC